MRLHIQMVIACIIFGAVGCTKQSGEKSQLEKSLISRIEGLGGSVGGSNSPGNGITVDLSFTGIEDRDLAFLTELPALQLQHLALVNTSITDDGLLYVKRLSSLNDLDLSGTAITSAGLKSISGLGIQTLRVERTKISDSGIASLKGLPLEELSLSETNISNEGLAGLCNFPRIRWILLSGTKITDAGLAQLKCLKELEYISVSWCDITDQGLATICEIKNLKRLDLSRTKITDRGLKQLCNISGLEWLALSGTGISDVGLQSLEKLDKLRLLDLSCTDVTEQAVMKLSSVLPATRILRQKDRIPDGVIVRNGCEKEKRTPYGPKNSAARQKRRENIKGTRKT